MSGATIARTSTRSTTTWGGGGLIVVGVLALLAAFSVVLPLLETLVIPVRTPVTSSVIAVVLLASTVVLARGVRGEPGIAGGSRVGPAALVVFGAGDLATWLLARVPVDLDPDSTTLPPIAYLSVALQIVVLVAGVIAAAAVAGAHVVRGCARWALVPIAVVQVVLAALFSTPLVVVTSPLLLWPVEAVLPVLLIGAGVALMLNGRSAEIRHRLQSIRDAW